MYLVLAGLAGRVSVVVGERRPLLSLRRVQLVAVFRTSRLSVSTSNSVLLILIFLLKPIFGLGV